MSDKLSVRHPPVLNEHDLIRQCTSNTMLDGFCDYTEFNNSVDGNGLVIAIRNEFDVEMIGFWDEIFVIAKHMGDILTELGKFHALSFAISDQRKDIFEKMFRIRKTFLDIFKGDGLAETMLSGSMQQTIDLLDNKEEIEVMVNVKEKYEVWIKDLLGEDAAGRFSVLNHGDLCNNNIIFKLEPNQQQRKLRLVDFQLLRLASPVIDITYFFCTSTNQDIYQRYDELLHIYYNSLAKFLLKLGSHPENLFTFTDLMDQFQQFGKYGLIFAPVLVGVMVSDASDILDMNSINEESKAEGLATLNEKSKILLKERMSSVIQLAIKNGWV